MLHSHDTDVWNRHRESKNTKLYEISSCTKLLFTFLSLKVSTWAERDRIFLCWLLLHLQLSTQPTRGARSAQSRLTSPSSESQPSSSEAGTQRTTFSQISAHASGAWRHLNTLVQIPIWDFYFDSSKWHILSARAWTPALMFHLTNPCAKRKVLSLTKPKGKIYKTKSLGNYITLISFCNLLTWLILIQFVWGCRIHWLFFAEGYPPPTSVQHMMQNNLMVRFQ